MLKTLDSKLKVPRGFSLVELLAVIAVIGILVALAIPAIGTLLEASKLNTAINQVADQISLARQTALAQNRRVEVRFYKFATPAEPDAAFRGIRSYVVSDTGASDPVSPVRELPAPLVISENSGQNTVFRATHQGTEDLPKAQDAPYFKFSFLPNGQTDLDAGDNPFLTIFSSRAAASAALPPNYAVLQIDVMTGNVRIFRPN